MSEQNVQESKKRKITSEQVEKACEHLGNAAVKVDSGFDNIKGNMGPLGKTFGFAVIMTFVISLFVSPSLVWVLGICMAIGSAPTIYKKMAEFKKSAEDSQKRKLEQKAAESTAEKDKK